MTVRNTAWLAKTRFSKAGASISILAAHQGEKIDAGGGGLLALLGALARKPPPDGRQHVPLDRVATAVALPERIAHRGKPRLVVVATKQIGKAHLARIHAHGRAGDRRLAEIEGGAVAADAAAHHHQPGRNRPQLDIAQGIGHRRETLRDLARMRLRQHRHGGAAGAGGGRPRGGFLWLRQLRAARWWALAGPDLAPS